MLCCGCKKYFSQFESFSRHVESESSETRVSWKERNSFEMCNLNFKMFSRCCECDHYLPVIKRKHGDCWHLGHVADLSNLEFQAVILAIRAVSCFSLMTNVVFVFSSTHAIEESWFTKISAVHVTWKSQSSATNVWDGTWVSNFFMPLSNFFLQFSFTDEINKHMQELSNEFEDLFDPYLPVASKLKIKMCPALGVSKIVINENQIAIKKKSFIHVQDHRVQWIRSVFQRGNSFILSRQMEGEKSSLISQLNRIFITIYSFLDKGWR